MIKTTLKRIEEIKRDGYSLDLGEAINEIFENYKNVALISGGVILLVAIVGIVIAGGFTATFVGLAAVTETFTDVDGFSSPVTTAALLVNLLISIIVYGLFAPIAAGIIQIVHNASENEAYDFSTAFMHYKSTFFKDLFLSAAIVTLAGSGLSTIVQIASVNDPGNFFNVGSIVSGIVSLVVPLFTIVQIPLIIFGKLQAVDAIKGSIVIVSKNFWTIVLLAIIFFIFAMLGILALCVGIFFTLPVFYAMQYTIYKAAIPLDKTNELDEIGKEFF